MAHRSGALRPEVMFAATEASLLQAEAEESQLLSLKRTDPVVQMSTLESE